MRAEIATHTKQITNLQIDFKKFKNVPKHLKDLDGRITSVNEIVGTHSEATKEMVNDLKEAFK